MTLIVLTAGWLLGLILGDWLLLPRSVGGVLALAGAALCLRKNQSSVRLGSVVLLGMGLGVLRMDAAQPRWEAAHIRHLIGQNTRLEAVIDEEPRWTPERQQIVVQVARIVHDGAVLPATGRMLIALPPEPPRRLGERLILSGMIAAPPAGKGFDYAAYLGRRGIWAMLDKPMVELAAPPEPSLRRSLGDLKERGRQVIIRLLPEPQASLLVGILLGIPNSIPPHLREAFTRTGTSHILVISGWNISILVLALLWVGQRLRWRRWPATLAALLMVVLYVLLVGPSPSVVRAAMMGAIVALATPLQRRADAWTALACACLLMTALNPHTLWDLGFQLSALATASLFAWGRLIEARLARLLRWRWLTWMVEPLTATLAAQIWALPIILYHFGNLSLIAPLANVLMLPAVPLAMAAGAALCCAGLVWRALGLLIVPLSWLTLSWLVTLAQLLAALPAASTTLIWPLWLVLIWYATTALLWGWIQQRQQRTHAVPTPASP